MTVLEIGGPAVQVCQRWPRGGILLRAHDNSESIGTTEIPSSVPCRRWTAHVMAAGRPVVPVCKVQPHVYVLKGMLVITSAVTSAAKPFITPQASEGHHVGRQRCWERVPRVSIGNMPPPLARLIPNPRHRSNSTEGSLTAYA